MPTSKNIFLKNSFCQPGIMTDPISKYRSIQKVNLAPLFTPIERCDRMEALVPELPELYIKRDDFIGSLVWGNKLRKLEYSLYDAQQKGADTILTYGGIQSNHARITAQVARRMGFECLLIMNGEPPEKPSANYLINQVLGISIRYVDDRTERHSTMLEVAEELKAKGKKPYCIPLGASDHIGSFGFVNAMEEIIRQEKEMGIQFDYIIHGGSSGGTQAGLMVGKKIFHRDGLKVIGISADDSEAEIKGYLMRAINPMLDFLGIPGAIVEDDLLVDDRYFGEGYALPTPLSSWAMEQFATVEGITLDATYTAKTAAAIIDYARSGKFKITDKVLFWHTGGLLNLFKS